MVSRRRPATGGRRDPRRAHHPASTPSIHPSVQLHAERARQSGNRLRAHIGAVRSQTPTRRLSVRGGIVRPGPVPPDPAPGADPMVQPGRSPAAAPFLALGGARCIHAVLGPLPDAELARPQESRPSRYVAGAGRRAAALAAPAGVRPVLRRVRRLHSVARGTCSRRCSSCRCWACAPESGPCPASPCWRGSVSESCSCSRPAWRCACRPAALYDLFPPAARNFLIRNF